MTSYDLSGFWRYSVEDRPEFSTSDYDDSDWGIIWVPSNWFLGGLDHHGVVWYRQVFTHAPQNDNRDIRYSIHFDGVDYGSRIFLNGEYLDEHIGYFEAFRLDVTDSLRIGNNYLAVRVDSPFEPVGPNGWHLYKRLIKGVLNHHDCRPGGGWDATGQAYNTGGIWNRVVLHEHGTIVVDRFLCSADLESDPPKLFVDLKLFNNAQDRKMSLRIVCQPQNFTSGEHYSKDFEIHAPQGASRHKIQLITPDVSIWQPWDRGEPHLYTVRLTGDLSESRTFGFRNVFIDHEFNWRVNGERYFPRGSNYIPSQWLAETLFPEVANAVEHPFGGHGFGAPTQLARGWFERDVALMVQANLNTIRVYAHVLPDEFYTACDRAGLMVWQDFPLQWGYSDELEFHDQAVEQVEAMVYHGYNHACIVAWCCHNESPWDAAWMTEKSNQPFDPTHNRFLDDALRQTIRGLDPTRYVHMNSGTGDGHPYPGWYSGEWKDFIDLPGAPFITEYGAQGLPVLDSLRRTFSNIGPDAGHALLRDFRSWLDERANLDESMDFTNTEPLSDEQQAAFEVWMLWRFHNFQPNETFKYGRVSLGASLEEFIASSQAYQSCILQFGTETYRRHKDTKVKGVFQFMFCDPWPAITWSVLDYWRIPKPAFDVLRRSMQSILPSADIWHAIPSGISFDFPLWVVNDGLEEFHRAICSWEIRDSIGDRIQSGQIHLNVPANGVSAEVIINCDELGSGKYELALFLRDSNGRLLGENFYVFTTGSDKNEQVNSLAANTKLGNGIKPMNVRLAIIGAGFISEIYAKAIQSNPKAELVALVEKFPHQAAQFEAKFGTVRRYENLEEMLADGSVDGVVVCTPNFLHATQSLTGLQAGLNMMVETPMAVNVEEAERMFDASVRSGNKLLVAHCWRFDREVLWLRKHVLDGRLGKIIHTKGYGVHVAWGPSGWYIDKRLSGGGSLVDLGIHAIDTARFLLGDPEPLSVYSRLGTHYIDADVDDTGLVIINWDNGASSYIETGWRQPQADGPEAAT